VLIRRRIQRACSLLNDATPARPTDPSHLVSGPPLPSPVDLLRLPTRLQTRAQVATKWIRVSTVVKQSSIVGPAVCCTVLNSRPARNSMLDTEKFFRVSRVSLTSPTRSKSDDPPRRYRHLNFPRWRPSSHLAAEPPSWIWQNQK